MTNIKQGFKPFHIVLSAKQLKIWQWFMTPHLLTLFASLIWIGYGFYVGDPEGESGSLPQALFWWILAIFNIPVLFLVLNFNAKKVRVIYFILSLPLVLASLITTVIFTYASLAGIFSSYNQETLLLAVRNFAFFSYCFLVISCSIWITMFTEIEE